MKSTDEVKVGAVTLGGFVILALMLTFWVYSVLRPGSISSMSSLTMSMVSKSATKSALPVFRLERSMIFSSMGPKSRLS